MEQIEQNFILTIPNLHTELQLLILLELYYLLSRNY